MTNYYGPLRDDPDPPPPDTTIADDRTTASGSNSFCGNVIEEEFELKYLRIEYGTFPAADDSAQPTSNADDQRVTNETNFTTGANDMTLKELVVANHTQLIQTIRATLPDEVKICSQNGMIIIDEKIEAIGPVAFKRYFGTPYRIQYGENGAVKYVLLLQIHTAVPINVIKQSTAIRQVMTNKMFMVEHTFLPETLEISMAGFVLGIPPGLYSQAHAFNLVAQALKSRKCDAQVSVYSKMLPIYPTATAKRRGKVRVFVVETPFCDRDRVRVALDRAFPKVCNQMGSFLSSETLARFASPDKKDKAQNALFDHAKFQDNCTVITIRTPLEDFNQVHDQVTEVDGVVTIDNNTNLHAKGVFRIIVARPKAIKARMKIYDLCGLEPPATRKDGTTSIATERSEEHSTTSTLTNWTTTVDNWFAEHCPNVQAPPTPGPKTYKQAAMPTPPPPPPPAIPQAIQCPPRNPTPSTTTPASQIGPAPESAHMAAIQRLTESISEMRTDFQRQLNALAPAPMETDRPPATLAPPVTPPVLKAPTAQDFRRLYEEQKAEIQKQKVDNAKLRDDLADMTAYVVAQREAAASQSTQASTLATPPRSQATQSEQSQAPVANDANLNKRKNAPSDSQQETPAKIVCADGEEPADFQ